MSGESDSLRKWLGEARSRRTAQGLQRQRMQLSRLGDCQVQVDGQALVNFSSNDYLGLATDPEIAAAVADTVQTHGAGSGASALVSGYSRLHQELEQGLARFLGTGSALLFPSGYHANLAVLTALAGRGDHIVQDRLCHASLIDGARLSGARLLRFNHCDVAALERQLQKRPEGHTLVVTDGVFSMDGDIAPLAKIIECCKRHDAWLVVDDAHGVGVLGEQGRGVLEHLGVPPADVPVQIGTLGKAFGIAGAYVAGSAALVEHLVNHARTYLYTTAMPPPMAAAGLKALEIIRRDKARRKSLHRNIRLFADGAAKRGLALLPSETPIQPLMIGEPGAAVAVSQGLRERGFLVVAIRPPTVPPGTARLRITLSADHGRSQIEGLLDAVEQCLKAA